MRFSLLLAPLLGAVAVQAHMQLFFPPPYKAANNPHTTGAPDTELQYPFGCCDKTFEAKCHGHADIIGTAEGASTATWQAGQPANFSLQGAGLHYGGSCQVSFSTDQGATFRVATSFEGNCPLRHGNANDPTTENFKFNVPADLPSGDVVFAWTWNNREQEFYMNCATVTIVSGGGAQGNASVGGSPTVSGTAALGTLAPASTPVATGFQLSDCTCDCSSATPDATGEDTEGSDCDCTCRPAGHKKRSRARQPEAAPEPIALPADMSPVQEGGLQKRSQHLVQCACSCDTDSAGSSGTIHCDTCSCVNIPSARVKRSSASSAAPIHERRQARHRHAHAAHKRHVVKTNAKRAVTVPFSQRPEVLMADTKTGCSSPLTVAELKYPNPGPDVVPGDGEYPLDLPTGNC